MYQDLSMHPRGEGGGTPHMKGVGMLIGNFELNPLIGPQLIEWIGYETCQILHLLICFCGPESAQR